MSVAEQMKIKTKEIIQPKKMRTISENQSNKPLI